MNKNGQSTIELLLVAGLGGILMVAGVYVLLQLGGINLNLNVSSERANLASAWWIRARSSQTCSASIVTGTALNIPTVTTAGITDIIFDMKDGPAGSTSILQGGLELQKYGQRVAANGFRFVIPANTSRVAFGGEFFWTGYVELTTEKLNANVIGGAKTHPTIIGPLTMKVNAANQIAGCSGEDNFDPKSKCVALGGSWNGALCTSISAPPCAAGSVMVGANPNPVCMTCPANNILVSNGSGFTCQPLIAVPTICPWSLVLSKPNIPTAAWAAPAIWDAGVDPWFTTAFHSVKANLNLTIMSSQYNNTYARQTGALSGPNFFPATPGPMVSNVPLGDCTNATNGDRGFHSFRQGSGAAGNNWIGMDFAYDCVCP